MEILTKTQISPSLAEAILTDNTYLLEAYLNARHERTQSTALAFVNRISGKEFDNPKAAVQWLSYF